MTIAFIITICTLLLLAYIFDLTAQNTKIPSVILLLFLGWVVKQVTVFIGIEIPVLYHLLPVFGTIGLILIVLEGALELEINKSKKRLIRISILSALIPLFMLSFIFAFALNYYTGVGMRTSLVNAIPLSIISSAIAIPSVKYFSKVNKEFIIYESSLSDIFGVIMFNFIVQNEIIDALSIGYFVFEIILMCIISFIATIGLAFLLSKINHHIKFAPIIILIIMIYAVAKQYHLPALIFILLFGLFLNNLDELKNYKWIKKVKPIELNKEVQKFKEIVGEGTFLIRALFFVLFGFFIETSDLLNPKTIIWSLSIVIAIFLIRIFHLKLSRLPIFPLAFIAPRGLITILLFLAISPQLQIELINKSFIIQVILFSSFLLMLGSIMSKKQ